MLPLFFLPFERRYLCVNVSLTQTLDTLTARSSIGQKAVFDAYQISHVKDSLTSGVCSVKDFLSACIIAIDPGYSAPKKVL